jgi:signal transduction histidine kinase
VGDRQAWDHGGVRWRSDRSARARWSVAGIWAVAAVGVGATLAGALVAASDGYALNFGGEPLGSMSIAMGLTLPGFAAAILTLRPRDRVGWVLGAQGMLRAFSVLALAWSYHGLVAAPGSLPWASPASLVGGMSLVATPLLLPLMVAWLPDGRPSPSFSWIPKAVAVVAAPLILVPVLGWSLQGADLLTGNGPATARNSLLDGVVSVVILGASGLSALGLVGFIEKWRLSAGVLRQQLKWVVFGVVVAVVTNTVAAAVPALWAVRLGGFVAMLAAVGVAVFRYRLFDIDRLITGTILYGALTAVLLGVVAATGVLTGSRYRLGSGTSVVAASLVTAVALIVLKPVHGWAQDRLDRLFDRGSWDAARRIRAFAASSGREPPQPGALQALLRDVLDDPDLTLAYRLVDGAQLDPFGRAVTAPPEGLVLDVVPLGSGEAVVAHRPVTAGDGNRFRRVLEESVAAFEHGRVQADLERQLSALRDSRTRLIAAGDTERRRIERDIHDGAQSQLVALGLALRRGQRRAGSDLGGPGHALIDEAVTGIQDAIAELRRFAQGVMSPLLVSNGIGAAVTELAARLPGAVAVDLDIPNRPPEGIESVLWFVTCEATTNALKHAPGAAITISIRAAHDQLRAEVTDAGPGGASVAHGSGLRGLSDRAEAVGGHLEVISPAGGGTTVRAVIPCGS